MKNPNIRIALFLLLLVSSVCSYIYLNTYQSIEATVLDEAEIESIEMDEDRPKEEVFLPDVRMIKRVFGTLQRLVPAS